jgi:hypothetical protein
MQADLPAWLELVDVLVVTDFPSYEVQATLASPSGLETVSAFGNNLTVATRRLAAKLNRAA